MKKTHKAFTLLEVILAIAISAFVLFACAQLMYNLTKTSELFEKKWSLINHADGVERFLRASFMNSQISNTSKLSGIIFSKNTNSLCVAKLPEEETSNNYYLVFSEKKPHPLYLPTTLVSPEKLCFLFFDENEGLSIVWKFLVSEDRKNDPIVYKTKLSKFVSAITYLYKDSDIWKEAQVLDTTLTNMPEFIKITFKRNSEEITRIISLSSQLDSQLAQ